MRYYTLRDTGHGCYVDYNGTKRGEAHRRAEKWRRLHNGWERRVYVIEARSLSEAVEKLAVKLKKK